MHRDFGLTPILSDIHKQNHYYFDDTQRIILKLLLTELIVFDSLNSYGKSGIAQI